MVNWSQKNRRRSRGHMLVWMAIVLPAMVGLLGIVCDTSYVVLVRHQLQNGADAAALAGAYSLGQNQNPAALAMSTAHGNRAGGKAITLASGDVELGNYVRTAGAQAGFHSGTTPYNAVRITTRRTASSAAGSLALFFGPMFGVPTTDLQQTAVAMISTTSPGITILDPSKSGALSMTGSGELNVTNGTIYVNSTNSTAVTVTGSGTINASSLTISGGYRLTGSATLPSNITTNASAAADPYASLAAPAIPSNMGVKVGNTYSAGYYPNGIRITGSGSYTFQSGTYYIANGISITGSASLTGSNVLFYVQSGAVNLSGSGTVSLTPASTGTYSDVTFFQAHGNTSNSSLSGSPSMNIQGIIYMPDSQLSISGSGGTISNAMVVKDLSMTGSGTITVSVSGPGVSGMPFLVQ